MISPLFLHYIVALIVLAALVVALITPVGRRVALWALGLQLLLGLWLIFTGFRPSPWHPALWLLTALFTQGAIFAGRGGRKMAAMLLSLLALASGAGAFYLGLLGQRHAVSATQFAQSKTLQDRTRGRSAIHQRSALGSASISVRLAAPSRSVQSPRPA